MKYRKKPVVIEAFRIGIDYIPDWAMDAVTTNKIILHSDVPVTSSYDPFDHSHKTWCEIKTLEGVIRGNHGDYIIQGVKGEIYPCKPDIFVATYEPVE